MEKTLSPSPGSASWATPATVVTAMLMVVGAAGVCARLTVVRESSQR